MKSICDTLSGVKASPLFKNGSYIPICLSSDLFAGAPPSTEAMQSVVNSQIGSCDLIGIGGYLEVRNIYHRESSYADYRLPNGQMRDTHIAIDFWTSAETPVYTPLDGVVHSMTYNPTVGQFGGCIVLKHEIEGITFHTLYGHLSRNSVVDYEEGQLVRAGQELALLGREFENGYWPPHLHFQIIVDMQDMYGDYYGVASPSELYFYRQNCPDPNLILKIECLNS